MSTDPREIQHGTDDVASSSVSGSAAITNRTSSTDFSLGQCPAVVAGEAYLLRGRLRLAAASGVQLVVSRTCGFYPAPACGGSLLSTSTGSLLPGDTAGQWLALESRLTAPAGAMSALCSFDLRTLDGAEFDASLDDLSLAPALLFADGFESGDTTTWSATVP